MTAAGAQLILEVGGECWPLRDGDIIGRLGSVGGGSLMKHDVLSRQHLRVSRSAEGWQITLLPASGNVTRLDGRLLEPGVPQPLADLSEVAVVGLRLALRIVPAVEEIDLSEAFPTSFVTLDAQLRVSSCNGAAAELFEGKLKAGADLAPLIDGDGWVRLRHALASLKEGACADELELRRADGEHWLAARFRRLGLLFYGALRDITVERTQRRAVQAAESRFLSRMDALESLLSHPAFREGDIPVALPLLLDQARALLPDAKTSVWRAKADGFALMAATDLTEVQTLSVESMTASAANRLVLEGMAQVDGADADVRLVLERKDASGWPEPQRRLAGMIGSLLRQAFANAERNRTLASLRAHEQKLAAELSDAARYIEKRLPEKLTTGAVLTDWVYQPCGRLGGDIFGVEWLDADSLALFVIDVMGHGSTAALHALSLAQTLRLLLARETAARNDPGRWLTEVNAAFPMEAHQGLLWTMWCGLYRPSTRELFYSSGGHPPAVLLHGSECELLTTEGPTLGALAEARFSSAKRKVPERAKLFFFSDGAYEFPVAGGGTGTLADFIGAVQGTAGMERGECAFLQARAAALCAEREFPDDFTIVCARFSG